MHARRRFEQAVKDGAKSRKNLASVGLSFYEKIYDLEEELKDKAPEERKKARDEIARPLFEETRSWAKINLPKVPDKSKIGEAFRYFLNQYESLTGYLQEGHLNADNGFTERAIRKFAIGRNNWMFSDTAAGADASALLYSLVVTAKANDVNVYRALTQVLASIPIAKTIEDYERLADFILTPQTTI